jgi:hypothetical protein
MCINLVTYQNNEIKVWQDLGHYIYQHYFHTDFHYDLLLYTFTCKRELGRLRKG